MDFNFTRIVFLSAAAVFGCICLLNYALKKYYPICFIRSYAYGKCAPPARNSFVSKLELPKSYFKHFYEFAGPASSIVLALAVSKYVYGCELPNFVYWILDLLFGTHRQALVSPESTLLAAILLTIHCWRRFYESHFISVFGDTKMKLMHYALAFIHYIGTTTCMIGESEGFVTGSSAVLRWDRLTALQYISAIIFICASVEQYKTNCILANLRKNKKGEVVTQSYKIAHGRLFKYISNPLQLMEITAYLMLSIILWKSSTYHCVSFFVLVNQAAYSLMTHSWYLENFADYPEQRKILIPYVW